MIDQKQKDIFLMIAKKALENEFDFNLAELDRFENSFDSTFKHLILQYIQDQKEHLNEIRFISTTRDKDTIENSR